MEYILFTDLHLGIHGNSSIWLEKSLELAEEMVSKAKSRGINKIIFAGDFFNDRRSLNTRTIDFAHKIMELFGDFEVFMIIGNHDTYFKNSNDVHSLSMFKNTEHVKIVNGTTQLGNITLVSWGEPLPVEADILIGHFEINGYIENAPKLHNAYEPEDFVEYSAVYSGHYHTPMKAANIHYIGSCMPFTFGDVDSPRGYYVLNDITKDLEFFEFKGAPKYVIMNSTEQLDADKIKGNIVKILFEEELGSNEEEKIIAAVQTHEPLHLHTEFKLVRSEGEMRRRGEETITHKISSNTQLFTDYIDVLDVPQHLNKSVLKGIINSLFN